MSSAPRDVAARASPSASRGTVAVAFSGGHDSTALLHATATAAAALGLQVVALHVHHGLMPQADAWLAAGRRRCEQWARRGLPVHFDAARLEGGPAKGDSVEAWARRGRRAALAALARHHGASLILLAHHRRDLAETVLLQALRGAGPAGLAGMPRAVRLDGLWWCRPWLDQPREAIEAYLRSHRLRVVDDPSNVDPRFARARLRTQVWPALVRAFPDAEQALTGVARRAYEADAALDLLATADLAGVVDDGGRLRTAAWSELAPPRRANALRAWLARTLGRSAPEALVQRLLSELPRLASGRFSVDAQRMLALHRGRVELIDVATGVHDVTSDSSAIDLSRPGLYRLPQWGGAIEVQPVESGGVAPAALQCCELRQRRGGEHFQSVPRGTPRSLKKQFQARGVAAWDRAGPLVFSQGRLLYVPGLGVDARRLFDDGPALTLQWRPDAPGLLHRNS